MKRIFPYFSLIISSLFLQCGCASTQVEKIEIIQSLNNYMENSPLCFLRDGNFECRLYRKGNHYYLESHQLESQLRAEYKSVKYLGENIKISKRGLFFGKDGRMHIGYLNNKGEECDSSVPFGIILGDKHISQEQLGNIFNLTDDPCSEKYGVAGVLKEEEPIVEAFLPTLQEHIRNDNAEAISKMFVYPIEISIFKLENHQDFLKYYPQIFTEELKNNILKLENKDIFCNYIGMMLDSGMWFCLYYDDKVYFFAFNPCVY